MISTIADPLIWALGYSSSKLADWVLTRRFQPDFESRLRDVVNSWAEALPAAEWINSATLFPDSNSSSENEIQLLRTRLNEGRIPTVEIWHAALLAQWKVARADGGVGEGKFFSLEVNIARSHLFRLATSIHALCMRQDRLVATSTLHEVRDLANDRFNYDSSQLTEIVEHAISARLSPFTEDLATIGDSLRRGPHALAAGARPRAESVGNDPDEQSIDTYRDLIKTKPKTALELLNGLKSKRWAECSERARFRIVTNIGAARLELGDDTGAAAAFREAILHDPDDLTGRCNVAVAHLIDGEFAQARAEAERIISEQADCTMAYVTLIAAVSRTELVFSTSFVPSTMLERGVIQQALGQAYALHKNFESAEAHYLQSLRIAPDNLQARAMHAETVLTRIFADPAASVGGQIGPTAVSELHEAVQSLESVWSEASGRESACNYVSYICTLARVLKFTGDRERAYLLAVAACRLSPANVETHKTAAFVAIDSGFPAVAYTHLEEISDSHDTEIELMRIECLGAADRATEALERLAKLDSRLHADEERRTRALLHCQLLVRSGNTNAAIEAVRDQLRDTGRNPMLVAALARALAASGRSEESLASARNAAESLESTDDRVARTYVADTLYELECFEDAFIVYDELVDTNRDALVFRRRLACCLQTDRRNEVVRALSSLPSTDRSKPFFRRAASALYCRTGELQKAFSELRAYLEECPNDLEYRLVWLSICQRLSKTDEAREFIDTCPGFEESQPELRMRLSHAFYTYGQKERALELAYQLLRSNQRVREVHMGYLALLLHGDFPHGWLHRSEIQPGDAFGVRTSFGEEKTFVLIDQGTDQLRNDEIDIGHAIAQAALGKSVGKEFYCPPNPMQDDRWTVSWVKSKYLHVLGESMNNFSSLFPDANNFWSVNIQGADGETDFSPVFRALDEQRTNALRLENIYKSGRVPLSSFAKMAGQSPLDMIGHLMANQNLAIRACLGTKAERDTALEILASTKNGIVADPLSLLLLIRLDVADNVKQAFGGISVTESTLDLYRNQISALETVGPSGTMSSTGDGYVFTENTRQDVSRRIAEHQAVLDWIRANGRVVPAVGKSDLPSETAALRQIMDESFVDSILAASGSNQPLLCEDQLLRDIAQEMFGVQGTWLQVALFGAVSSDSIDYQKFSEVSAQLVEAGFTFTSINARILHEIARLDKWIVSFRFQQTVATLGEPAVDLLSSIDVTEEFLSLVWRGRTPVSRRVAYTHAILSGIRAWRAPEILAKLVDLSVATRDRKSYHAALRSWCHGHFLLDWM